MCRAQKKKTSVTSQNVPLDVRQMPITSLIRLQRRRATSLSLEQSVQAGGVATDDTMSVGRFGRSSFHATQCYRERRDRSVARQHRKQPFALPPSRLAQLLLHRQRLWRYYPKLASKHQPALTTAAGDAAADEQADEPAIIAAPRPRAISKVRSYPSLSGEGRSS